MKKFLIASIAIAIASFTQAATVQWYSGDLSQYVTSEITDVTAYYYVIDGDTYTTLGLANMTQADIYEAFKDKLNTTDASAVVAMNDLGMANAELDLTTDPAYVVSIYKFDSKHGGAYALASALEYSEPTPDSETGLPDPADITTESVAEKAYAAGNNGAGGWTAVPEPTTVALLAIGLAAVGLKRKVA